ncbi:hypothetical protein [Streptomyces sp. NPDC005805]|uniref:SCO7613 C-terminal domain-containing membrane protein n=1 Tax=Streptomyces sp. NPDC005805 TaxID=3157068 RepID=UPI0033DA1A93
MGHAPPPAEELSAIDGELRRLDARRAQLLARRAWLLAAMGQAAAVRPAARGPYGPPRASAPPRGLWAPQGTPAAARPASGPGAQNVLLTLGGVLLAVAAIAFTLVSWGHLGIGGRAAVLGTVTLAAFAAPAVLLRRGLTSTAEAVGVLALVLSLLDAYALHRVAFADADGLAYTAWACAVLAALWTAQGLAFPRLRTPLPAAVVVGQFALPLWALSDAVAGPPVEWALLATAALDVAVVLWARPVVVRGFAGTAAAVWGVLVLLIGGARSVAADAPVEALEPGALLLGAAGLALFTAWRVRAAAVALSTTAGLAVVAAVGGFAGAGLPDGWPVVVYLLCGSALLAAARPVLPRGVLRGLGLASATVHAAAALTALPLTLLALVGPASRLASVWQGAPSDARAASALGIPLTSASTASVLVVLLLLTATCALLALRPSTLPAWGAAPAAGAPGAPHTAGAPPQGSPGAAHPATGAVPRTPPVGPAAAAGTSAQPGGAPGATPVPPHVGAGPASAHPAAEAADASTTGTPPVGPGAPVGPDPTSAGGAGPASAHPGGAPAAPPVPPAPERRPSFQSAAAAGAIGLGWAAALVVPLAAGLGYGTAVVWQLLVALAATAWGLGRAGVARAANPFGATAPTVTALVCGLTTCLSAALLALGTRPATFAVLGTLVAALAAGAVHASGPARSSVAAGAAVLAATGLAGAVAGAAGLSATGTALVLLAVPALAALVGARLGRNPVALTVEGTSAVAAVLAVGLAASDGPAPLALVLALCGVIAAGTAVRPERRPVAGWTAAALFLAATWFRLYASEVTAPEAYTLPVTVPALVVGYLRMRRDPGASSWTACGPGLLVTAVPSLLRVWGDEGWQRPLLLGLAALAVTLAGARLRLRAPLLVGGTVLALVAVHELAPYVVQVVGALPRWLPPALAGLLLLAVGATYERRLRDARRLRRTLAGMR